MTDKRSLKERGLAFIRREAKWIAGMLLLIFLLLPMLAAMAVPQLLQWISALGFLD